jgi:NADH-quinone oxidoreductase subunit G
VVDLCPVGALISKDFLFKQRVWLLQTARSVSPADSRGSTIWIDHNRKGVHRIRPRYNPRVNEWWISDEARFGWKYLNSDQRLNMPLVRRDGELVSISWEGLSGLLRDCFASAGSEDEGAAVAAVLSPMMSCEEAWLLGRFIRSAAPKATLVLGHVPSEGADKTFPNGFVIKAEKCPNRRGVEQVIAHYGGGTMSFDEFVAAAGAGKLRTAYVAGGYPKEWITARQAEALSRIETLVVHDLFPSLLDAHAAVQIPSASFVEREGSFVNCDGLLQPFERAITPLEGVKPDGQFFFELAGESGLFRAEQVRGSAAAEVAMFAQVYVPPDEPKYAH